MSQVLKKLITGICILFITATLCIAQNTIPVFSDDFSTQSLLAEQWEMKSAKSWSVINGVLFAENSGTAVLKRKVEGDFVISADLKPVNFNINNKSGGFAGITFNGIIFALRSDGFWYVYRLVGQNRSLGNMVKQTLKEGDTYHLEVSCRKTGAAWMYTFTANEKAVATFIEPGTIQGSGSDVGLTSSNIQLTFDNFMVAKLEAGEVSKNMVTNSSFEYLQDTTPLYWHPGDTLTVIGNYGTLENFWEVWRADTTEKHSGKQSMRLECNNINQSNYIQSHNISVSAKNPIVYSVYLKADREELPGTLEVWEMFGKYHRKEIKVGKEWARYEMCIPGPDKSAVKVAVGFKTTGVLWVDDVQVETGSNASPYTLSSLDTKLDNIPVAVRLPDKIVLKKFNTPPVIDGKLESIWKDATPATKFFIGGKNEPKEKTEAWMGVDDHNLYIAFKCYSANPAGMIANATVHDRAVWNDDCVEIFLDPGLSRKNYYQLVVNAKGIKADMGLGRNLAWNPQWEARTSINTTDSCLDIEIMIPLNEIAIGENASNRWGINLGRNNVTAKEASCTSLNESTAPNFHRVDVYGIVEWPEGILDKYAVQFNNFRLLADPLTEKLIAEGSIVNSTRKAIDGIFEIGDEKTVRIEAKLGAGQALPVAVEIPDLKVTGRKADLTAKFSDSSGKLLKTVCLSCNVTRGLETYTRYNYYMDEAEAVLIAEINIPGLDKLSAKLRFNNRQWDVKNLSQTTYINIPISEMAAGSYPVSMEIFKDSQSLAKSETVLIKRTYQANGTQIDRERRCLIVDGKPFLVIAPMHGGTPDTKLIEKIVNHCRDAGFNSLLLVASMNRNTFALEMNSYLIACEVAKLKVLAWPCPNLKVDASGIKQLVAEYGKAASLIAWMPVDEPELDAKIKPDDVAKYINDFREIDPYHPAFMNNSVMAIPANYANLAGDILSIDDYLTNREGRKVEEVLAGVHMMNRAAAPGRKPVFVFLSGNNLSNHYREPSPGEQVAETYGSFISGAAGVYYFLGQPAGRDHWKAYVQTNKELLSLSDIITSLEKSPAAVIADKSVVAMTRKAGNKLYVISVNIDNKAIETTVTLPATFKYGKVNVMFENRQINSEGNSFKEKYAPYERHVYEIDINP